MSRRSVLFAFSLGANFALAAAFLARPAATATYFRGFFSAAPATEAPRSASAAPARAKTAAGDVTAFAWNDADAADIVGLVGRLRAAGFPPSVVRTIVYAVVNQQFDERQRDIARERMPRNYWQNNRTDLAKNLELQNRMRALNREREKVLKDALGDDYNRAGIDDPWAALHRERQFGSIPAEKIEQFNKINADYNELTQKVHEDSLGILLPEDRAKLALLEKEKKADLARLFTPDEALEYELRNSDTAANVRTFAGRFDLTEEEFRALYAAQKNFDEANPRDRPTRAMPSRRAALDATFREVLGEDRYAALKQANDPALDPGNQEMLTRLVTRLNLDPSTVPNVLAVQQDIQQRSNAIRANKTLTPGERDAQLSALANEATAKLTPLIGASGVEVYKQNGGQWLIQGGGGQLSGIRGFAPPN